jgi:hypothetical protein
MLNNAPHVAESPFAAYREAALCAPSSPDAIVGIASI